MARKAAEMKPVLTKTEHQALAEVKRLHGLPWRARLRKAWENGTLANLVGLTGPTSTLARLKGKIGPAGLAAYRFPKDC